MILLTAMFLSPTVDASPMVSVSMGQQRLLTDGCAGTGSTTRVSALWHTPLFSVGPVVQGARHDYCLFEVPVEDGELRRATGDFQLTSAGPGIALPRLAEFGPLTFGAHADVLAEWYRSAIPGSYHYQIYYDISITPQDELGTEGVLVRAALGADLALTLADTPTAPELVLSADAAYNTGLGLVSMASVGLRVNSIR